MVSVLRNCSAFILLCMIHQPPILPLGFFPPRLKKQKRTEGKMNSAENQTDGFKIEQLLCALKRM